MSQLFTNNASGTLSVAMIIEAGPSAVTLQTNEGQLFPSPTGSDFFICTVEDTGGVIEILRCTSNNGNNILTCVRAQESTSAAEFATGSRVELRTTAGTFAEFLQLVGGVMAGELDLNNENLRDPLILNGESRNMTIRGTDGGVANQLIVPTAGAAPTIGGNEIIHTGNDSLYALQAITFTGGEGIAVIGDLSANRTVDLDITEFASIEGNAISALDDFLVYDASAAVHKKMAFQVAGVPIITASTQTISPTDSQMNSMFLCTHSAAEISLELNTGVGVQGNVVIVQQSDSARKVTIGGTATINSAHTSVRTVKQYSVLICIQVATNVWTVYGDGE